MHPPKEEKLALTVSRDRIKERCGVSGSDFDVIIDNLIADLVPAIEFSIQNDYINDTANTGLQSLLTYAATEIVTGECFAQMSRQFGFREKIRVGELSIESSTPLDDQSAKGWSRLRPFLKTEFGVALATSIKTAPKVAQ